jgi:hypothetical protein
MSGARDDARSPRARAIGIVLRTAHIGAMALLVGAQQFAAPDATLGLWRTLTAATGLALLVSEMSHSRHWIYQGRGLTTCAHVGALALVLASASLGRYATLAALAIGSVGSHLPRTLRKWSFRHRRVVD